MDGRFGAWRRVRFAFGGTETIMARRAVISSAGLKGYLLEEVVASLISNAGYRLLTSPQDDPHDLCLTGNGLQVRGRGGYHQADVLGELLWAPAFGNPVRLFIEAKWRGESRKVGIPEARHAVGILQDVNQVLVTVGSRSGGIGDDSDDDDVANSGRSYCYTYRYALCSTSGFTTGAQAYALAHQVALIDLSHEDYDELREALDSVGDVLQRYLQRLDRSASDDSSTTRSGLLRSIRATLREALWRAPFDGADEERFLGMLRPLINATRRIGELFVGVSATGFVILLKADDPELMVEHMRSENDPHTSVHYRRDEDGSFQWQITVSSDRAEPCRLFFVLPEAMLRALDDKNENRRAIALNMKEQHFSRVTVYRITEARSMICSLKLDADWLAGARRRLEDRSRRRSPG